MKTASSGASSGSLDHSRRIGCVVVLVFGLVGGPGTDVAAGSRLDVGTVSGAYGLVDGERIVIGNESIEATFSIPQLFALTSLDDKRHGTSLIGNRDGIFALWWLQLAEQDGLVDLFSFSSDPEQISHSLVSDGDEVQLTMVWRRLFDGVSWREIMITVEIEATAGQPHMDWRIRVENGEQLMLVKCFFPLITGISTLGESGVDDRIAYPQGEGYLVEEPLVALADGIPWSGFSAYGGGDWRFSSDYPGPISLQLVSFYEEGRGGYMLTALDGGAAAKGFPLASGDGWFLLSVLHYPELYQVGNQLTPAYPIRIGVFDGDWQDAAVIYRDWALAQTWTRKGRLHERTDVPAWWKESALTVHLESYDDLGEEIVSTEDGRALVEFLAEQLGQAFTVRWRGGFQELRPEEIEEFTGLAHSLGATVLYHTNGRLNMGDRHPELHGSTAIDWKGTPYTEDNEYWSGGIMCPAAEDWRDHISSQWVEVLDHGADGIYVDQVAVSPWVPCFDEAHDHEAGRTGAWWVETQSSLHGEAMALIESQHPLTLWASEMQSEVYLPLYASALSWQVGVDSLFGMRFRRHARSIPLFQFVYGGFTAPFGADSPLTDWTVESPILDYNLAYDFISGKTPAMFFNPAGNFDTQNLFQPTWQYLLDLAELRAGVLSDFLYAGEMLRDPPVIAERLDLVTLAPSHLEVPPGTPLLLVDGAGLSVIEGDWRTEVSVELIIPSRSTRALVADPAFVILPSPRRATGRVTP